ncbi:MAG: hypothetical protein ACPLKX_05640 [Dictyoglomaceae bacterium]
MGKILDFLKKVERPAIYTFFISILIILLYMLFNIFFWLRIQSFIISHEIIINARYALELSITKNERIVYNFHYSTKTKSIQFYWVYGEKSKKTYLLPHLIPSGIKCESPTRTYTFYFENGNIYPEGEIILSTYLSKRAIKFYRNGNIFLSKF